MLYSRTQLWSRGFHKETSSKYTFLTVYRTNTTAAFKHYLFERGDRHSNWWVSSRRCFERSQLSYSLTEKKKLDLSRRSFAVSSEVFIDHLAPLYSGLVLGTQCATHLDIYKKELEMFEAFSRESTAESFELSHSRESNATNRSPKLATGFLGRLLSKAHVFRCLTNSPWRIFVRFSVKVMALLFALMQQPTKATPAHRTNPARTAAGNEKSRIWGLRLQCARFLIIFAISLPLNCLVDCYFKILIIW